MSVPGRTRGLLPEHPSPPYPFPRCSRRTERADAAPDHLRPSGAGSCRCAGVARMGALSGIIHCALYRLRKAFPPAGHGASSAALPWLPAEAAAHGLAPTRPRCPHRPDAAALRGLARDKFIPHEAQKPLRGSSRRRRQERRSPWWNRVGGEIEKRKLKSKGTTKNKGAAGGEQLGAVLTFII